MVSVAGPEIELRSIPKIRLDDPQGPISRQFAAAFTPTLP
jgi:hypothetical protein